jgi:hypothetical protein
MESLGVEAGARERRRCGGEGNWRHEKEKGGRGTKVKGGATGDKELEGGKDTMAEGLMACRDGVTVGQAGGAERASVSLSAMADMSL